MTNKIYILNWSDVRPVIMNVEREIIKRILNQRYKNELPSERELVKEFKVNRQKIRETLQRLQQDGWIQIQHGKPTKIKFIWDEGGLNILNSLIKNHILDLPVFDLNKKEFLIQLLEIRSILSPFYAEKALKNNNIMVRNYLEENLNSNHKITQFLEDPLSITSFDWNLHLILCKGSQNIPLVFLFNSFKEIYYFYGKKYFSQSEARTLSVEFYKNFYKYVLSNKIREAVKEMKSITIKSIQVLSQTNLETKE